jgi:hypothetical protein
MGHRPLDQVRGQVFVRVNQVLVRLWARSSLCLTERFPGSHRTSSMGAGRSAMMQRSEANCCVLSKSDSACADIIHLHPSSGQARGQC